MVDEGAELKRWVALKAVPIRDRSITVTFGTASFDDVI